VRSRLEYRSSTQRMARRIGKMKLLRRSPRISCVLQTSYRYVFFHSKPQDLSLTRALIESIVAESGPLWTSDGQDTLSMNRERVMPPMTGCLYASRYHERRFNWPFTPWNLIREIGPAQRREIVYRRVGNPMSNQRARRWSSTVYELTGKTKV
jgi:hypothetical protein